MSNILNNRRLSLLEDIVKVIVLFLFDTDLGRYLGYTHAEPSKHISLLFKSGRSDIKKPPAWPGYVLGCVVPLILLLPLDGPFQHFGTIVHQLSCYSGNCEQKTYVCK